MRSAIVALAVLALTLTLAPQNASFASPINVRLSNDVAGGYVSAYTLATGVLYSDSVIDECKIARGRQNEPAVAIDPRNTSVVLGSSNDYCGVYQNVGGTLQPVGPIWLGYYRSQNGGQTFTSSLVPGYPQDTSPYAALAHIRTASSGDPVIAWDSYGRAFFGSESSDDPSGTKKTFGDVWAATFDNPDGPSGATINDGKRFVGSEVIAKGTSAPNLLGKFNDKTAIEADRTGTSCDANVYFVWSRFTGNGGVAIYFSRSTDHGKTWSSPKKISSAKDVQFPDIAITGNGHVYVTWRTFDAQSKSQDSIQYAKSTDCGNTFAPAVTIRAILANDAVDVADPQPIPAQSAADDPRSEEEPDASGSLARDCGDFGAACQSGYTFFRRDTQVRSSADQKDTTREWIYIVYDGTKAGTETATGTTYGTNGPGTAGQARTFFFVLNGATGTSTAPRMLDDAAAGGHQVFPDINADQGVLFAIWWDSRNDPTYSVVRPIGNTAAGVTTKSLDVYSTASIDRGTTWSASQQLTNFTSNPNYEQFGNRTVPFAGDYLWVSSVGGTAYAVWTDWRNTVPGLDPREGATDTDHDAADVKQCRTFSSTSGWSGDTCPHDGGLDQDIYGSTIP